MNIRINSASDIGARKENQDRARVLARTSNSAAALVCDGLGGEVHGRMAAELAAAAFEQAWKMLNGGAADGSSIRTPIAR